MIENASNLSLNAGYLVGSWKVKRKTKKGVHGLNALLIYTYGKYRIFEETFVQSLG